MTPPRVLVSDALSPRAVEIFRERGIEVDQRVGLAAPELEAIIGGYDGLAVRSATRVTAALIAAAGRLRVIGRAGIGIDNVDLAAATARGIVVMNTPFGNSITTAEHAIAMIFALARQIPQADASTRAGKWEKSRFLGVELTGKTLGIVGCGNIGAIVAERAVGLRMKVLASDPYLTPERARSLGVEKVELEALFARADFITLHTPLTPQTRNLLDAGALARCRRGVRIVNCARGGLVDEAALGAALQSGQVGGAALDVFLEEPARQNPLFALDNVVCTPHLGAATVEAQENVALQVAQQMSDFLLLGAVNNALNMPAVSAEDAPRLRPYLQLAEQLGTMLGQVLAPQTQVRSVSLSFEGQVARGNTRPLVNVVLTGLLRPSSDFVNGVNAPVIARERGIKVAETRVEEEGDYHTLVRVAVSSGAGSLELAGTLFSGRPRLVAIDDVALESELASRMLFVRNRDAPGFIGSLGTTLGACGINIANFNLGRSAPGNDAVCLVSVDQDIPGDVLAKIRALPGVIGAHTLWFG
jgi:D-3-phosphoglycerate dehydrogenase